MSLLELWKSSIAANLGVVLLVVSHFLTSVMFVACKLLEADENFKEPISPIQILFVRMLITYLLCLVYMYLTKKVEDAPFGPRSQRVFLVLRGVFGFIGVFGIYYSLQYLTVADTVSISFLTPMCTALVAWIILSEKFSLLEGICALVSLAGVLLIAKPSFLFGNSALEGSQDANSGKRMVAIVMAMAGVAGASVVYVLLRKIGKLAHPLISVSYFALVTCIATFSATVFVPSLQFQIPHTPRQWLLFILIGISGFFMQFCMAAGLQREKAGKSSLMVYLDMVFALIWDFVIWGKLPGITSILGMILIVGNAFLVIKYEPAVEELAEEDLEGKFARVEEVALSDFAISDEESES